MEPTNLDESVTDVRFLTVMEVATVMRVSVMTVHRIIRSGELPAVRFGRSFRIPENALRNYLAHNFLERDRRRDNNKSRCDRCDQPLEKLQ